MSRKYRQQGYQDSDREERSRSSDRKKERPRDNLTQEERIQRRSLRHAIDREASQIVRCHNCGREAQTDGAVSFDTVCLHCRTALHCCRACTHFDTSARRQCRAEITEAIGDKLKPNHCSHYQPQLVLDVTGRRTSSSGSRASGDPRSQFENLFKR